MASPYSIRTNSEQANIHDLGDLLPCIASNLAVALDLAGRGFAVFSCNAEKKPLTPHGFADATADADQIRRWWRAHPNALPALPTGARNGFDVLDLDRHSGDQDGIEALRALDLDPDTISSFIVHTAGGGRHLYFQHRAGVGNGDSHLPAGINVRGEGGYVIAPGAVLPDDRRYVPDGTLDPVTLPPWPAPLLPKPNHDLSHLLGDSLPVDWNDVRRALEFVPPDCGRDDWMRIGMALHAAGCRSQEAFRIWDGWSAGSIEKYEPRIMEGQWRSFGRRSGVDIGSLFHIAAEHGWSRAPNISPDDFEDLPPLLPPSPSRLTLLSPAECEAAPSRGYVIKGLIAPSDVACIFGAPGAGKSLLAPHLGYAVAQGRETFGMRSKPGSVLYVVAEDPHGMRGRVRALKDSHGDAPTFCLVEGVSNLLAEKSADLAALVEAVKERRPALIVIDTLAMAFPGLEENDSRSMGRVVTVARLLTKWGAAVVLIHHDTKAEGSTPRGHSLLNGALDVALHVKRDDNGVIRGRLTKNRNGTCDRDIAFKIAVEHCGFDDDGDPVTLPRCLDLPAAPKPAAEKLTRPERVALDVLRSLGKADRKTWREAAIANDALAASEEYEARKKAFNRAVAALSEKRLIQSKDGIFREYDPFDDFGPIAFEDEQ